MGCHLGRAWDGGSGNPLHFTTASLLEWGNRRRAAACVTECGSGVEVRIPER